ncbi:U7 snRNA-associated Sm-like protein LSm10, partial [Asbolus verrucosus]
LRMQQWGSRKEKYSYYNYLTSIVKGLENKHTIIDLRNESCVSGLIKQVDGLMNVEMENDANIDLRISILVPGTLDMFIFLRDYLL